MQNKYPHHHDKKRDLAQGKAANPAPVPWKIVYWVLGIGSTVWLLLRSGSRPRRLAYPCQRVAAVNSAGFLAYLAALLGSAALLRRLKTAFSPARVLLFAAALLLAATLQASVTVPVEPILADSPPIPSWTSPTAISNVFAITNVPEPTCTLDGGNISDCSSAYEAFHDGGVDALVNLMETNADYFYETSAHPDGIFGSDDVIVIKVNNQWDGRNGTNSDVLKGVIYELLQHPDGFTGAVIVAENPQTHNEDWDTEASGTNSQFRDQSYEEVAQAFEGQGHDVCISDWKSIRTDFVDEYDDVGDTRNDNGYVLDAGDNKLSYPKFSISCGDVYSISMRYGLWDNTSFDDTRLKMINLPVLKRHGAAWATIAVKNYLGFITTHADNDHIRWSDVSEIHCWLTGPSANGYSCTPESTTYGLVGRQMAYVRRADLDIVDAVWVNPRSNSGWHGEAERLDILLASRDPFAVDYYASDYILGPLIHTEYPADDYEQAMASTTGGYFRNIQLHNVASLRAAGVTDTINMDDGMTNQQELDQFNAYVADANAPTEPTLTLQVPNGGQTWNVGTQQQIQWASSGDVGNVRLEYSTDGFSTPVVITSSTSNDGSYTWTIPNDPSDTVLVRVSSTLTGTISDTSNSEFAIVYVPPTLSLQSPDGGESWEVGTQQQIAWSSENLSGDVRLDYSTDDFASSTPIVASTSDDGVYDWTIPNDPSDTVLVRVSSALTGTISDTSTSVFSIFFVAPSLDLQSPDGGETWEVGTQQQIAWNSENLSGDVRLDYSTDGFATLTPIVVSTSDDGAYDWTIPADPSYNVLVRVSSVQSGVVSDTSVAEFTITGPYTFDDSYKTVSHHDLEGGERLTYTIVLYEAVTATLTVTDAIPVPLTYVTASVNVEPEGRGTLELPGAYIRWSGIVTGTVPVTITFQADVPVTTTTMAVINYAQASRNDTPVVELTAVSMLNSFRAYLPVVFRNY